MVRNAKKIDDGEKGEKSDQLKTKEKHTYILTLLKKKKEKK